MRERVARSRQLVARGRKVAVVARVMQISRQAIYRTPKPRTRPGPPALTSRELKRPISRKRAQRAMRAERLLQRHRPSGLRLPGHFRVERPD